jgi:flagellar hook-associated protein 3 FlgL
VSTGRITQSMMTRAVLSDIQDVSGRLSKTREKLSSGKELTRPSDNPYQVSRALQYRSELGQNQQHQKAVDEANAWQNVTDTALGEIGDIVLRARDLAVQGANGATPASDRATIAREIDQLIQSAKSAANAQYAGRYVFSGTSTLTPPFSLTDDAYHGDTGSISREIGPGVQIGVNVTGDTVLGDASNGLIKTLRDLQAHLNANDIGAISHDLGAIDTVHEAVVTARTDVGARTNRLDAAQSRLSQLEETTTSLLSNTEDADMAKTLIDASTQQAVYQSALRAGAQIVQTSLLDFLN